jgi:UDP-N-acetylmuramoylalanine--D-glutamate ligase
MKGLNMAISESEKFELMNEECVERHLEEFKSLEEKNVLVLGAARSGICSAELLLRNGAKVTVFDQNVKIDKEAFFSHFENGVKPALVLGDFTEDLIKDVDLVVISPGIFPDLPFVTTIRDAGIPVWGEIELAAHFNKGRVAAITGTNGKTTTTTLVGEIFKAYNSKSLIVGNIGIPFTGFADKTFPGQLISAEISSYQMQITYTFHPEVSALLNLTPDHLNRHGTFERYADAKMRLTRNADEKNTFVMNYDDPEVRKRGETITHMKISWFSRLNEVSEGAFLRDGWIIIRHAGEEISVLPLSEIQILGAHNVENVLAASLITYLMGVPVEVIRSTVAAFKGVEHRIEYVKTVKGVKYYNDSKGTNPDAAIKAIEAMVTPTVLIGGGYDKHNEYDEWINAFGDKVKYLVLLGETAQAIEDTALRLGFKNIVRVKDLEEAVSTCYKLAEPGDSVLLSPACASWDMFKDFEQRGEMFKDYVRALED